MKQLQAISVTAIALVLAANLALSEVWPRIYVELHAEELAEAVVACATARNSYDVAAEIAASIEQEKEEATFLAAQVELLDCYEHDRVRSRFLANGVNANRVWLLELEALEDERVPLRRVVETYQ